MNFGVVVLAHKRTEHLKIVIDSLNRCSGKQPLRIVFACDRPSSAVIDVIENSPLINKEIVFTRGSPESVAQAINRNLFNGLHRIFSLPEIDFVVVLEDDVVPMPDFFNFFSFSNCHFADNYFYRGTNAFSNFSSLKGEEDSFVRANFGLGWGWSINRKIYNKWLNFWTGEENNHWDFIVEPYTRTGFVVNPVYSRIISIGADETASHHSGDEARRQVQEIELSARMISSEVSIFHEARLAIGWRIDFFCMSGRSRLHNSFILLVGKICFVFNIMNFHKSSFGSHFLHILRNLVLHIDKNSGNSFLD